MIGRTIRLGARTAKVIGVLEPSVPYPEDTEIIANIVTSPHHLSATMEDGRTHRMTELFGRLAPGATIDQARAELIAAHKAMVGANPASYPARADMQLTVTPFGVRDQIAAPARTILLVLLAAAAVVFVIACSNVANLILARSVRREGELAVRAALGAGTGALRRTLLGESLVLCGAGAVLGILLARPFVGLVARYAARFSVRALDITVDPSVLWVGSGLAMAAAVLLAFVPRLPSLGQRLGRGLGLASGSLRITPGTSRRLRAFATTQIACSFVLLGGAGMLLTTLVSLQHANTGYDMRHVLVFDIPMSATGVGVGDAKLLDFYQQATDRVARLPGVDGVRSACSRRGATPAALVPACRSPSTATRRRMARNSRARGSASSRHASFPWSASRSSPAATSPTKIAPARERVVIVSQSVAERLFPNGEALNRKMWWVDPVLRPEAAAAPHRRHRGRRRRRERRRPLGDDGVSPRPSGGRGRPVVRARGRGSVRARAGGDESDPRDRSGTAGRARRDARRRARRGAVARTRQRVRLLGVRRHRGAHRRRRRGGRARLLGERTDARVRRAAGHRVRATALC